MPTRNAAAWSEEDIATLRQMTRDGRPVSEIAKALGCTHGGIHREARRLQISLNSDGSIVNKSRRHAITRFPRRWNIAKAAAAGTLLALAVECYDRLEGNRSDSLFGVVVFSGFGALVFAAVLSLRNWLITTRNR